MDREYYQDGNLEKFMNDYLKNEADAREKAQKEELVVNFDISYPDGDKESFVCGENSEVFGHEYGCIEDNEVSEHEDGCIENRIEPEVMKCYFDENNIDMVTEFENDDYQGKWINCEEEITEKINKEKKEFIRGDITVLSRLKSVDGIKLKGVKINLYKINGICPELVESSITDCDGCVVFSNIPEGNYRVIEIIDKRYFEKPTYINWNEVRIDCDCNEFTIFIINTIKKNCICKCRR